MSLISEQVDELRTYATDKKGELAKLINNAADTIEMLSAKLSAYMTPVDLFPDLTDEEKKASREYAQGYTDALKDTSQKWIPCDERLPIEARHYLCSFNKPNRIDKIYVDLAYWTGGRWYGYRQDQINAWMPLPEPYREGE